MLSAGFVSPACALDDVRTTKPAVRIPVDATSRVEADGLDRRSVLMESMLGKGLLAMV